MELQEHKKLGLFTNDQRSAINEFIEYLDAHYDVVDDDGNSCMGESVLYEMLQVNAKQLEKERKWILEHTGV